MQLNEMICKVLMLFIFVSHAVSDSCVRYTFEENFNDWLLSGWGGFCVSMPDFGVGKYSNLDLTGQNERSTSFITPLSEFSCVSSFLFSMNFGGTVEVNIYMEATDATDQIHVLSYLLDSNGDIITGMISNSAMAPNYVSGWQTLTMTLVVPETYDGYISIMGMASPNSTVLVDSFRYIPPGMDESACRLYEDDSIAHHPRAKYARAKRSGA